MVRTIHCGIGGMETHQRAFLSYFFNSPKGKSRPFRYVVERTDSTCRVTEYCDGQYTLVSELAPIACLKETLKVSSEEKLLFFFNDGWWVDQLGSLRDLFPTSKMVIRVGGNEIGLVPWPEHQLTYEKRWMLWRKELNNLDYIIANSNYTVSLLHKFHLSLPKVVKIRGGVNEDVCGVLRKNKNELKRELRMRLGITKKYLIAFACRFVPFKGIIPALELLRNAEPFNECFVILLGSGKLQEDILTWCNNNLSPKQYAYLGEKSNEDVLRILAAVDILLNPSLLLKTKSGDGEYYHTETMGRTMMESVSVGTKVFATDVGGTAELFEECQGAGILVEPDGDSLKAGFNSIEDALQQPMIIADYGWDTVFGQYTRLFVEPKRI